MANNPSASEYPLRRGYACLVCRRRKVKCDGAKPACRECIRMHKAEDCEYTNQGSTELERLEYRVTRLQDQLHGRQMQTRDETPISLHDPYASYHEEHANQHTLLNSPLDRARGGDLASQDPSRLIGTVLKYAQQLGFALNISRFLACINSPQHVHPALLKCLMAWGIRLSSSDVYAHLEIQYVQEATNFLVENIGNSHTKMRLQALQAEVLLAQYHFASWRFLEGRLHVSRAVTLTLTYGLHQIRSVLRTDSTMNAIRSLVGGADATTLSPPINAAEETERVNLFWAVLVVDRDISAAVEMPPFLSDNGINKRRIDTPWPLDDSRSIRENLVVPSSNTVREFLTGSQRSNAVCGGDLEMRAKASLLFEYSDRTKKVYNANFPPEGLAEFTKIDRVIREVAQTLPSLDQLGELSTDTRTTWLVTRSLVHAARIQLHQPRESSESADSMCIQSATIIVHILEYIITQRIEVLEPAIGLSWIVATRTLVDDATNTDLLGRPSRSAESSKVEVTRIRHLTSKIAKMCPIMSLLVPTTIYSSRVLTLSDIQSFSFLKLKIF
ncbi:hypothetical protein BD410DRAFT_781941 [Rickenella mellea]|uniref:Zn(2)-C6 fungal-type domain-containing protein n=1 Tax=Rickenella mellea TaxID=50990 RepID=A0A4Y7QMC5_9AGAM|nr:hypothetical protein BD410DRAFT_781941 [Rickenella mellea]